MIVESGPLIGALVAARIFRRGSWGFFGAGLAGILHYLAALATVVRAFHGEMTTPLWINALAFVGAYGILEGVQYLAEADGKAAPQKARYELGSWLGAILLLGASTLADPDDGKFFPVGAVLVVVSGLLVWMGNRTTTTLFFEIAGFATGLVVQPDTTWLAASVGTGLAAAAIWLTGRTPYWDLGKGNLDG